MLKPRGPLALAAHAGHRVQCRTAGTGLNFSEWLLELTLFRLLLALVQPFQRVLTLNVFLGRALWNIGVDLRRLVWLLLGWFAAPPRTPFLRSFGRKTVVLRRWHWTLATLAAYVAIRRTIRKIKEASDDTELEKRRLRAKMETSGSYEEWSLAATKLDAVEGLDPQKQLARWRRETRLYDRRLLEERLKHLREVRRNGDVAEMMFALRADLLRNLGNMTNSELHEHFPVVPEPIREYIDEVKLHLQHLTDYEGYDLTLEEKLNFLRETRHAFGRTALVLSGGGALGAFHVGVVKALFEQGLLPRVLAGSSVGSIVAATIATRNDEELHELFSHAEDFDLSFFANTTLSQFVRHFLANGCLQDSAMLQTRLRNLLGDASFLQAFQHSGRILNVAVCPADTNEPPRVLNYLTAPHVLVWSAVSCSSAFPLLFSPQNLLARNARGELVKFTAEAMRESERRWRDGSLEEDLPMRCLSEMFNVNYFLVSQTNPHIVPALNLKKRLHRKLGNCLEAEWKHRCRQLMDIWPGMRWLKVVSQPWEGDVTMVLPSAYMQVKKSITNPSQHDLIHACHQGEHATWAKLSAIQANCGIEMTLDRCMLQLCEAANARRHSAATARRSAPRLSSRIPSWIHLSALGMPQVGSEDAMDGKRAAPEDVPFMVSRPPSRPVPRVSSLDSVDEAAELDAPPPVPGPRALRHGDALLAAGDCCDASVDHNWSFPDRSLNIWKTLTPLAVSAASSRARLSLLGAEGGALDAIAP